MKLQNIKDKELIFGKKYQLSEGVTMMISVNEGGLLTEYSGLQVKFEVRVQAPLHMGPPPKNVSRTFLVPERGLFQPMAGGDVYKIIARKSGDDNNIKPNWRYFLLQYEVG